MRFVFPLSVPEGTKTGTNLNAKLKGIFDTASTACLKEDGSIWIEAEDLIRPEDKERSKSQHTPIYDVAHPFDIRNKLDFHGVRENIGLFIRVVEIHYAN